jgi:hypothetical protein
MPRRRPKPHDRCPHCDARFPRGRSACPECGSDAETGWNEDALSGYTAADIPDTFDEDAYLDAVSDLPGAPQRGTGKVTQRRHFMTTVGIVTVLAFIAAFVVKSPRLAGVIVIAATLIFLLASPRRN